jgi:hypothetical protein
MGNWGAAPVVVALFAALVLLMVLVITILIIWIYCRIFSKAGYSWALGLLMLVPIANIVMLCVLAFDDWPVLRELRQLKQQAGGDKQQVS